MSGIRFVATCDGQKQESSMSLSEVADLVKDGILRIHSQKMGFESTFKWDEYEAENLLPEAEQWSEIGAMDWEDLVLQAAMEPVEVPTQLDYPISDPEAAPSWRRAWCLAVWRYVNTQDHYNRLSQYRLGRTRQGWKQFIPKRAPGWAEYGLVEYTRYFKVRTAEEVRAVLVRDTDDAFYVLVQDTDDTGHWETAESGKKYYVPGYWNTRYTLGVSSQTSGLALLEKLRRQFTMDAADASQASTEGWDWHPHDIPWDPTRLPASYFDPEAGMHQVMRARASLGVRVPDDDPEPTWREVDPRL